jgi:multiple sugar transport system permease protein
MRETPGLRWFRRIRMTIITLMILGPLYVILTSSAKPLADVQDTFRGRRVFTTAVLSTQMFPGILFLLPLLLIFVRIQTTIGLQLNGSYTGLIITYMTFSLPFAIWMLVGFLSVQRYLIRGLTAGAVK